MSLNTNQVHNWQNAKICGLFFINVTLMTWFFRVNMVLNATFNNISVILWWFDSLKKLGFFGGGVKMHPSLLQSQTQMLIPDIMLFVFFRIIYCTFMSVLTCLTLIQSVDTELKISSKVLGMQNRKFIRRSNLNEISLTQTIKKN
jgi:hypothetical protein